MTQTLESLRSRIQSIEELQSVVTTMKAMAAVNIRHYEKAVHSLAEYNRNIERGFEIALRHRPEEIKIAQPVLSGPLGAIVFGSDQGMVGQFNQEIVDRVLTMQKNGPLKGRTCTLLAVGRRVAVRLSQNVQTASKTLSMPGSIAGITPLVQDLLVRIEDWREQQSIEQIFLFYNMPIQGASYRPTVLQLLPVDLNWLLSLEERQWPARGLPTYTMDWDTLFSALVGEYFFISLVRACAESLASENANRLSSMQVAEKNIEDRLDELSHQYHHLRQSSITEELMDVVAGYEALAEKD
jgi:F-type H+-transporting ATPase subunit gamma